MNQNSPCSAGFGDPKSINYCAPLKQLIDEHPSLLAKMAEFNQMVQAFETSEEIEDWNDTINQLHEKISAFIAELEPHSNREEDVLFEMMVKYLGREGGPIAVMEYEHNTAKLNLKEFMEKATAIKEDNKTLSRAEALDVYRHLKIVYLTLTDHFMKEENILFPMAEQMLSDAEKQDLADQFSQMA
ncbi:hemerythrin domain-containing protein [Anaerobacillus isosaccharinicus]|uniref:Hemerythrin domain-containing protein n=1 Tax=Anaerobacillus isosaccharinicus TaxID=1532552 RepID=A0A7S7L474_9BACI|nr:hemerythrin domain-containing protein [Anaerobacillus isosaccharinicus]MBA5587717.1 hemerythrin domain-containing protein [Anaerobacillus isosaccharinicus]QOY34118.1 hemerythrin domain-containing protein [Anaerobacillus isosaccharinicus]